MKFKLIFALAFVLQMSITAIAQTSTKNYVQTMTARQPVPSSVPLSSYSNAPGTVQTDITYFDGLGRPIQQISKQATPGQLDLVLPYFYDPMGRMDKEALPYKSSVDSGTYRSNWYNEHINYYTDTQSNGAVKTVNYPFSKSTYEASPLSRVIEQSSPGEAWKPSEFGGTRVVKYLYRTNTTGEVKKFSVSLSEDQTITTDADYGVNLLWVSEMTDEDGNKTLEFTNQTGQVICKKAAVGTTDETHTYYVYDIHDRLTFVIPPQAVEEMGTNWGLLNDFSFRDRWLFRYRYDQRNRMIEKQVPGAAMVEMVYDKRDRLVFTLDGNRRSIGSTSSQVEFVESGTRTVTSYEGKSYVRAPGARIVLKKPGFQASKLDNFSVQKSTSAYPSEWLYTKYDELNRPVLTGIKSMVASRADLQAVMDTTTTYDFSVSYIGTMPGNIHGYDDSSYPSATGTEVLSVTYYDNYDFVDHFMEGTTSNDYKHAGAQPSATGLVTGGKVRVLGSTDFLNSTTYYDDRFRVIASCTENYFGFADKVITTYRNDISPLVANTVTTHKKGSTTTIVTEAFTYDHRDRLLTHTHQIDNNPARTLASNTYNDMGQLIEKDLHDTNTPVQSVDYRYNERGWLATINGGSDNLDDATDQFGMELKYDDAPTPNYNGNIGQLLWKSKGGGLTEVAQDYQYAYDPLNRLKSANYTGAGNFDVSNISYDKNGNIQTLQRNTIDNLDYDYLGNQLTQVEDATSNTQGFKDVSSAVGTQEYRYDKNGNMISDTNKGITAITYNYLNLPQQVTLNTGTTIHYTYDAAGIKHQKVADDGSPDTTTYIGGLHYTNGDLKFLQHAEGRALKSGTIWTYEYHLKDHLGNVRVSVDESGSVVQRDGYYPFGLTFNSSATSPENLYKLSVNEEQKEWDVFDFNARMYDPILGRFNSIDPLTETQDSWTPYHYNFSNPVAFVDPTGLMPEASHREMLMFGIAKKMAENVYSSSEEGVDNSMDSDNNGFDDSEQSDVVENPEIAPTASGRNGGRFGNTRKNRNGTPRFHDGTDIKASKGTAIRSILPGKIIYVRENFYPGQYGRDSYGNIVAVESIDAHGNSVILYYNHLDISTSYVGREVGSGEVIGFAGNSGNAGYRGKKVGTRNGRAVYDGNFTSFENAAIAEENNHVHVKARRNGQRVDPEIYMKTKFNRHGISKSAVSNIFKRMGF